MSTRFQQEEEEQYCRSVSSSCSSRWISIGTGIGTGICGGRREKEEEEEEKTEQEQKEVPATQIWECRKGEKGRTGRLLNYWINL